MKIKKKVEIKRPIVFVPMCLDYFHHGHANIINRAKRYGNIILGLVSDKGISSYKKKPHNNFKQRKKIALMLKDIKKIITVKSLDHFLSLSKKYKFDYFVHGDDWKKEPQSGIRSEVKNVLEKWNGKVIDIPYTKNISSTIIKKRIRRWKIK